MPSEEPKETDKGDRVLFSTGPYKHKLGWVNNSKASTKLQQPVIVVKNEKLHATRVRVETLCTYDESPATCVEEAAMKRAKFLSAMNQFAWLVAKYNIALNDEDCRLFQKFAALVEEKKALLTSMGEDADWKVVIFRHPLTNEVVSNFNNH